MPTGINGSMADLGLGSVLGSQVQDETEEEKRKRLLGLSGAAKDLFNFGNTGVGAVASLGLGGGVGRRS